MSILGCSYARIVKKQREDDKCLHMEEQRLDLEKKMAERESEHGKDMLEF